MLGWAGEAVQPSNIFFEVENMEFEYQLAFAAICPWARSSWVGKWNDDLFKAWRKLSTLSLGMSSGVQRVQFVVNKMTRACAKLGAPLRHVTPCLTAGPQRPASLNSSMEQQADRRNEGWRVV